MGGSDELTALSIIEIDPAFHPFETNMTTSIPARVGAPVLENALVRSASRSSENKASASNGSSLAVIPKELPKASDPLKSSPPQIASASSSSLAGQTGKASMTFKGFLGRLCGAILGGLRVVAALVWSPVTFVKYTMAKNIHGNNADATVKRASVMLGKVPGELDVIDPLSDPGKTFKSSIEFAKKALDQYHQVSRAKGMNDPAKTVDGIQLANEALGAIRSAEAALDQIPQEERDQKWNEAKDNLVAPRTAIERAVKDLEQFKTARYLANHVLGWVSLDAFSKTYHRFADWADGQRGFGEDRPATERTTIEKWKAEAKDGVITYKNQRAWTFGAVLCGLKEGDPGLFTRRETSVRPTKSLGALLCGSKHEIARQAEATKLVKDWTQPTASHIQPANSESR